MPGCRPSPAAARNMQRSCERSAPSLFTSPRGYTQSRDSDSKRACVLVSPLRACPPYHGRLGLATQVGNGTAVATWPQPTFGTVGSTVNDRFGSRAVAQSCLLDRCPLLAPSVQCEFARLNPSHAVSRPLVCGGSGCHVGSRLNFELVGASRLSQPGRADFGGRPAQPITDRRRGLRS
jgi:hypothetical protein